MVQWLIACDWGKCLTNHKHRHKMVLWMLHYADILEVLGAIIYTPGVCWILIHTPYSTHSTCSTNRYKTISFEYPLFIISASYVTRLLKNTDNLALSSVTLKQVMCLLNLFKRKNLLNKNLEGPIHKLRQRMVNKRIPQLALILHIP